MSRLCRYKPHKTAVIQSAHRSFLIQTSALASCWALSQYTESVYTMFLRIHLPVFVDNPHGRQRVAPVCSVIVLVKCSVELHVSTSIYQITHTCSISGRTRISVTRVRQLQGKRYILTYLYSVRRGHCHNQCGACSGSPQ